MTPLKRTLLAGLTALVYQLNAAVPTDAADAQPWEKGAKVPSVSVNNLSGEAVALDELVSAKPTVLIFYRGGWCPYCTKHLAAVQKAQDKITDLGLQVVGISPDRPAKNKEAGMKHDIGYTLLSDSSAEAMKAFGVAFKVPDSLVSKYKNEYGIDIHGDSGETHNILPVPALYLVGTDGTIRFAHFDANYRERLGTGQILTKLKRAAAFENM